MFDGNKAARAKAFNKYVVLQFASDLFENGSPDGIYGYMKVNDPSENDSECHGSSEIKLAAAVKGYGPLMYDIAMSNSPNHEIHADRVAVSTDARAVWSFFRDKRSDVEALKFDNVDDPQTPSPEDDCNVHEPEKNSAVDYAYKGSKTVNVSGMESVHARFAKAIVNIAAGTDIGRGTGETWLVDSDVDDGLISAGANFFDLKYGK